MTLYGFTRFPSLPPEIRTHIWRLSLRQPRVHRLRITTGDEVQSVVLHPTETLPRSTITTRNILATCRESRAEAIRALPDSLSLGRKYILRFNKHEDVICLAKLDSKIIAGVATILQA